MPDVQELTAEQTLSKARQFEALLHGVCDSIGMPRTEVVFKAQSEWGIQVFWEAGPYEWAIPMSMIVGRWLEMLVEPGYSFSLCFSGEASSHKDMRKWYLEMGTDIGAQPTEDDVKRALLGALGEEAGF